MKTEILVAGFDAFGDLEINPSGVLSAQIQRHFHGRRVMSTVLPTSYTRAWRVLNAEIKEKAPGIVLIFGYSSKVRAALQLEPLAANRDLARVPDNDGVTRQARTVLEGGSATRRSSLPIASVVEALSSNGVDVAVASEPSGYVCNHTYYRLLGSLMGSGRQGLLVHVPGPSLSQGTVQASFQLVESLLRPEVSGLVASLPSEDNHDLGSQGGTS